jgi:glyoxylate/hydroxypyruvate reductase A
LPAGAQLPTLLLISGEKSWPTELKRHMPDLEVRHFPDVGDPLEIDYALVWMPALGLMKSLPNLKVIFSLAAGVDHLLRDPDLPSHIPIVRMHDPYQAAMMAECALYAVLHFHRGMHVYRTRQSQTVWKQEAVRYTPDHTAAVLGLGDIGRGIAEKLRILGFRVGGWSRTPRKIDGIDCYHGPDQLTALLERSRYVVCVLPSTEATRGLLDASRIAAMPRGSYIINLGRGAHIVDEDLTAALDSGHIEGAFLDVFRSEPLPADHRFWSHPGIVVTPHTAGELLPRSAARTVTASIRAHLAGEPLTHVYEPGRGY